MQEKFHEFNRPDNKNIIAEGLSEGDSFTENIPAKHVKKKEATDYESVKRSEQSISESVEQLVGIKKPSDILRLSPRLKKEGLKTVRENVAKRYLAIARIEKIFFEKIEKVGMAEEIDFDTLTLEMMSEAEALGLDSTEDQRIISLLARHFRSDAEKIKLLKHMSEVEIFGHLIRNPDFIPLIKGKYKVTITLFSVHFAFENIEDFRLFISDSEGEAKKEYENTYGLSYSNKSFPITASGYMYNADQTYRHETQHKKFIALTMDTILEDDKAERDTRDEVLARFAERGDTVSILNDVLFYEFAKKYGVDEERYKFELSEAIKAIQQLIYLHFKSEEIIGLLSKEKLNSWPKVVDRIINSEVGRALIKQRKHKRVKKNKSVAV